VVNVTGEINSALAERTFESQQELDRELVGLDGTPNKARLGANSLLAVSLAFARATAAQRAAPLYRYFAGMLGAPLVTLPRLTVNLFSGGRHAGGQSPLQDVLVVPASATSIDEALATTFAVYQAAAGLIGRKYGMRVLRADEGGLAPPFPRPEAMFEDAVEAITLAGFQPGREVALAVDVAATHFHRAGTYDLGPDCLDSAALVARLAEWTRRYPIVSVEDGLAEDDWENWPKLRAALAPRALVVGDDLLCTNPARIRRAIGAQAADTLLLKVNQIGTLTEAGEACRLARAAGWRVTISARSGETEDHWLADLAAGWQGDQIKVGSITQSERLAKYNRLLAIEAETRLPVVAWPNS
jgi:enolase